jgi:hypothetical protein
MHLRDPPRSGNEQPASSALRNLRTVSSARRPIVRGLSSASCDFRRPRSGVDKQRAVLRSAQPHYETKHRQGDLGSKLVFRVGQHIKTGDLGDASQAIPNCILV